MLSRFKSPFGKLSPGAFASRDTKDFKPAISSPFASKPNIEKATFQVISDLHLEREGADAYSTYAKKIPVKADFLIIAGDIGEVHTPNEGWFYFIEELYLKDPGWKRIFIVAGHSEYSNKLGQKITDTNSLIRKWQGTRPNEEKERRGCTFSKLNKVQYLIDGNITDLDPKHIASPGSKYNFTSGNLNGRAVVILGCTLWSQLRKDYAFMDSGIPGFSADAYREMYEKHIRALRSQVAELRKDWPGAKIIVITHHAPAIQGTAKPAQDGKGNIWSHFQSDILGGEGLEGLRDGDVWVHGHTHYSCDFRQDEVRVISNQRGGVIHDASNDTGFDVNFTFEMEFDMTINYGYTRTEDNKDEYDEDECGEDECDEDECGEDEYNEDE